MERAQVSGQTPVLFAAMAEGSSRAGRRHSCRVARSASRGSASDRNRRMSAPCAQFQVVRRIGRPRIRCHASSQALQVGKHGPTVCDLSRCRGAHVRASRPFWRPCLAHAAGAGQVAQCAIALKAERVLSVRSDGASEPESVPSLPAGLALVLGVPGLAGSSE